MTAPQTPIPPIDLPPAIDWSTREADANEHIAKLTNVLKQPSNHRNFIEALAEVCREVAIPSRKEVASYWKPYLIGLAKIEDFFSQWLTYTPVPANPGKYIEYWDYLVNTKGGLKLSVEPTFVAWFTSFLNFHGDWINSKSSTTTLPLWMAYKGTPAHPFSMDTYRKPDPNSPTGGFESFRDFFLRNVADGTRPLCPEAGSADTIVSPCDGGVFYLTKGGDPLTKAYSLPGKSDPFNLEEALPGWGKYFEGGVLLDILLWFTDFHHFHAPVSGTVIHHGLYHGSYNYDFGYYDPTDFYAPQLPKDSDRVGWYQKLAKHQRYVWIIRTESMGLVAMMAIGFWGVGSIVNAVSDDSSLEKGQYMGHFDYGGSSIVLAFSPEYDFKFEAGNIPISDPDHPVLMNVRGCLGKCLGLLPQPRAVGSQSVATAPSRPSGPFARFRRACSCCTRP